MAQLQDFDGVKICVGISELSKEVDSENLVPINEGDQVEIGYKYENGEWVVGNFLPQPDRGPSDIEILGQQLVALELRLLQLESGGIE